MSFKIALRIVQRSFMNSKHYHTL